MTSYTADSNKFEAMAQSRWLTDAKNIIHLDRRLCRVILLLFAVSDLAALGGFLPDTIAARDSAFVSDNLEWETPPARLGHSYQVAAGTILLFRESGEFEQVYTLLYRNPAGAISVSINGRYSIREGLWNSVRAGHGGRQEPLALHQRG